MRHPRGGFTIIELLAVVTIIGVLATIALPRYGALRARALRASMISDLRSLVTAQEGFFSANDDYAGSVTSGRDVAGTAGAGSVALQPSTGNQVSLEYHGGAGPGWSATVTNAAMGTPIVCGVFVGAMSYSPDAAVLEPGVPVCY